MAANNGCVSGIRLPLMGISVHASSHIRRSAAARFASALFHPLASLSYERDRWFLWVPALLGIGVAIYFSLEIEPSPWLSALSIASLVVANGALLFRDRSSKGSGRQILALSILLVAVGFAAAQLRTNLLNSPAIEKATGPTTISGEVVQVERFATGSRLTLRKVVVGSLTAKQALDRVRLHTRTDNALPRPGSRVSLVAVLEPLGAPSAPGGFDLQRYGYFQRLGAVGFVVGDVRIIGQRSDKDWSPETWFESLRRTIADNVRLHHDNAAGAVIIALLIGETSEIPISTLNAVRDAGLAHLLSISGVHIGMVATIIFFWFRLLVAAIPLLALRLDPKKLAAIFAILGATFYALVSGNSVPTQRSLLMLTVVMIGVLVGRRALSMRLLAWAALVILITQPEAMLGASFQMSFAAMVALIAASERSFLGPESSPPPRPAVLQRTMKYVAAIIGSSVIATLATAPFAIFHFNRLALIGVLTNLIAIPLTGFWILPWGMLALLMMPLGIEDLALTPMAWGTELLIWLAEVAASVPGAAILVPILPVSGLVLIVCGGLWVCLWRTEWRFAGFIAIAAGIASMAFVKAPDILVDGRGSLIGVRLDDGSVAVSTASGSRLSRRSWSQRSGEEKPSAVWPKTGSLDGGRLRCDRLGCIMNVGEEVVAFPRAAIARTDDCRQASLVIASDPFPRPCHSANNVFDWWDLWRGGAHAIWVEDAGLRIETVNGTRGRRPWIRGIYADSSAEDP